MKAVPDRRQRHYLHVLENALGTRLGRGEPFASALEGAEETAARTVNRFRAARASGRVLCKPDRRMKRGQRVVKCRVDRGPKLVGQGGSRRAWYPGKKLTPGKRPIYACLMHTRRFKTKGALLRHYRTH